jgi:hypothetical protein
MKKIVTSVILGLSLNAHAVDRIVEEFGVSPTFPSINAAVAASADGDRIIVRNRAGNIPWIENVAIDKSLQFLSYENDDFFYVQGNYSIIPANDRQVTIIGMRNTAGFVQANAGSSNTRGTRVRVVDSFFVNGGIQLASQFFDVDVVGCTLQRGTIGISYGNVIGNDIDGSNIEDEGISVTVAAGASVLDTCAIYGNKVKGRVGYPGIFVDSDRQVVHIRNNYVQHGWMGINVYRGNSTSVQNLIWNNTVTAYTGNFTTYGIILANTTAGSIWEVMNNVVTSTWPGENRGIYKDSGNQGQINVYFNHVAGTSIPISPDFTFVGNNTIDQPIALNLDGTLANAPGAVNGGNPAAPFFDLDLSIGDAGAYGGSYTLTNFHPLHTGSARVYMTGHPYNVRQGSTLRVKAFGYDR